MERWPLDFEDVEGLIGSLEGVDTLYNTYWVRFEHGGVGHLDAVINTEVLVRSAVKAGVRRLAQVSVAGASSKSSLSYFRGKGLVEEAVREGVCDHPADVVVRAGGRAVEQR